MKEFTSGPFLFAPQGAKIINGQLSTAWNIAYGPQGLAMHHVSAEATQDQVREAFASDIASFIGATRKRGTPGLVLLIDQETDTAVASFSALDIPNMTPGLIDDRARYWLRSVDRLRSRPVTLPEFAVLAAAYTAPKNAWMAEILPAIVLTSDPEEWRAPTSWELRHLVGEGSFTKISGAKAAVMVGISPQNFRKYTASDDAKNRQSISFAMWHLLLHKLNVQSLSVL